MKMVILIIIGIIIIIVFFDDPILYLITNDYLHSLQTYLKNIQ